MLGVSSESPNFPTFTVEVKNPSTNRVEAEVSSISRVWMESTPVHEIRVECINGQKLIYLKDSEFVELVRQNAFEGRDIYYLGALFVPIRTDSHEAFLKDLTLPLFFNSSIKTDNVVLRTLAVIAQLVIDVATLPIRMITGAIRYFFLYGPKKEEHPFYKFLENHNFDFSQLASTERIQINTRSLKEAYDLSANEEIKEKGFKDSKNGNVNIHTRSSNLNFVEMAFQEHDPYRSVRRPHCLSSVDPSDKQFYDRVYSHLDRLGDSFRTEEEVENILNS